MFGVFTYNKYNQNTKAMSLAVTLIKTLTFTRADVTVLKTATNVLNELYRLKKEKRMPFFAVRRAIKMQESIVKNLNK